MCFPISGTHWVDLGWRWWQWGGGGQRAPRPNPAHFPGQEKLRYLQQQLQDETPRRQEAQLQELEQKLEAGLSRQGCAGPPGSPDEPPRPRSLALGCWGAGARAGEGLIMSEQEVQKVSAGLEDLR